MIWNTDLKHYQEHELVEEISETLAIFIAILIFILAGLVW